MVLSSGQERALLLGEAITCPLQLDEPAWHSMGDVVPALAARTRERLWRELEDGHTAGTGAHFPECGLGKCCVVAPASGSPDKALSGNGLVAIPSSRNMEQAGTTTAVTGPSRVCRATG